MSVPFIVVGPGYRGRNFVRVARELPDRFRVSHLVTRDAAKAERLQSELGILCTNDLDRALRVDKPAFALLSVPWSATPGLIGTLLDRGVPVLTETPPAPDLDGLRQLVTRVGLDARVQVAEQYPFQPAHAARLAVVESGKIGKPTFARVSVAHGYHGISLVRRLLGIGFEAAHITARRFSASIVAGSGRQGPPNEERMIESEQVLAWIDFGDRMAEFDFTGEQYFSWIRARHLLVRGTHGELETNTVRSLMDYKTPMTEHLERVEAGQDGNLEGFSLSGIIAGGRWLYQNAYFPARLSDDEIAMATVLDRMGSYAAGGPSFYSLGEACQDHYLGLCIDRAADCEETVSTQWEPWAL